jgi:hypothetical protein
MSGNGRAARLRCAADGVEMLEFGCGDPLQQNGSLRQQ